MLSQESEVLASTLLLHAPCHMDDYFYFWEVIFAAFPASDPGCFSLRLSPAVTCGSALHFQSAPDDLFAFASMPGDHSPDLGLPRQEIAFQAEGNAYTTLKRKKKRKRKRKKLHAKPRKILHEPEAK